MDPRVDKVAQILVNYSIPVQKGDLVMIRGGTLTEEMALAVYHHVLLVGCS